ncbi:YrhB domain-containing protein [Amycolatopsis sp. w19]|uniref:YrhB domain-containing protein n=1 Tax=Amycolatopsis sp. w19 TaxID=3448134 RepID=UPI003F1CC331
MVLQDAFEAAQQFLDEEIRPEHALELVIVKCAEDEEGWAFSYNSRAFVEDGDIVSSLVGNGPIIVPRSGAAPYIGSMFGRSDL